MIYSDNTYDITNNIATYTRRDFKSVFDTTSNKWYMLNNLNNYEEYGIYGDSFDTYYQGKLVIVNDHEYEWDGTKWDDLGEITGELGNVSFREYFPDQASFTTKTINNVHFDMNRPAATSGNEDVYFSYNGPGSTTAIVPRFSMYYSSGRYTDTGFSDRLINLLPQDSSGFYYYDFSGGEAYLSNFTGDRFGKYLTYTTWDYVYTYINTEVKPKYYTTKTTPTILTLWASTIYRNSAHLTTLMRNDAEMTKIDYMSDDILKKGEAPLPYNTKAYLKFSDSTSYSNSPRFETSVYLKNTYTVEIKLKTPANNGYKWRQVVGAFENGLNSNEFGLYTSNNNLYFCMNWWQYNHTGDRLFNNTAFTMAANTEYIFEIQVGTGVTKINGVTQSASGGNNVSGTLNKVMKICATDHTDDPGFNGQIYYVKVTDENNDLVAYYEANNENGTPGYLDKVSGTKIINVGSGTVTYGED